MKPTDEQASAVRMAKTGKTMKLNAFAGAGKTATLKLIANELAPKKGLYLAFNKTIAEEAKRKMPPNVEARTFHSIALGGVPKWMRDKLSVPQMHINDFVKRFSIDTIHIESFDKIYVQDNEGNVTSKIVDCTKPVSPYKLKRVIDDAIKKFVVSEDRTPRKKYIKEALEEEFADEMQVQPQVFKSLEERMVYIMEVLWEDYTSEHGTFGLAGNHDIYLKHWSNSNPIINADFILFDEAQDADGLMLRVLNRQVAQVIFVGDKHQQIYGWRGAVNALESIDADEGFLTQSFRFGQQLAERCQPILEYLGEKKIIKGTGDDTTVSSLSGRGVVDAVLCRTNGGVIAKMLELVDDEIECRLNIDVKSAIKMLEDMNDLRENTKDIDLSSQNVGIYKTKNQRLQFRSWSELEMYIADYGGDMETSLYYRIITSYPLSMIVAILHKSVKSEDGVFITTAHKAKGMEWDRVALCNDFLNTYFEMDGSEVLMTPASENFKEKRLKKYNVSPDLMIPTLKEVDSEELRLLYVAMTRARKMLYMGDTQLILDSYFKYHDLYFKED